MSDVSRLATLPGGKEAIITIVESQSMNPEILAECIQQISSTDAGF